jgi:hypothetical protein
MLCSQDELPMNDGVSFTPRPTLERATAKCLLCRDVRAMVSTAKLWSPLVAR